RHLRREDDARRDGALLDDRRHAPQPRRRPQRDRELRDVLVQTMNPSVGDVLPPLVVKILARHVVMGASSSRDWQPQHHDTHWAVERVKVKDIFLNTPNQAGWIERYLTDWTGPEGRLAKVRFKMKKSVCAGDTLRFEG